MMTPAERIAQWRAEAETSRRYAGATRQEQALNFVRADTLERCVEEIEQALAGATQPRSKKSPTLPAYTGTEAIFDTGWEVIQPPFHTRMMKRMPDGEAVHATAWWSHDGAQWEAHWTSMEPVGEGDCETLRSAKIRATNAAKAALAEQQGGG